jgi:hypothetical protein
MFEQLFHDIAANPWLYAPAGGVLVLAAILHLLLRGPTPGSRRRGLLFGIGSVAVFATLVFVAYVYSFVRLLARGTASFDLVWSGSAVATAALAAWLWVRFVRVWRQA